MLDEEERNEKQEVTYKYYASILSEPPQITFTPINSKAILDSCHLQALGVSWVSLGCLLVSWILGGNLALQRPTLHFNLWYPPAEMRLKRALESASGNDAQRPTPHELE